MPKILFFNRSKSEPFKNRTIHQLNYFWTFKFRTHSVFEPPLYSNAPNPSCCGMLIFLIVIRKTNNFIWFSVPNCTCNGSFCYWNRLSCNCWQAFTSLNRWSKYSSLWSFGAYTLLTMTDRFFPTNFTITRSPLSDLYRHSSSVQTI